ncbi:hypothetical protein GCM10009525_61150 [Streptosporangium amethystogenes subsp. fukuiense]
MPEVNALVDVVRSGLSTPVAGAVVDEGDLIRGWPRRGPGAGVRPGPGMDDQRLRGDGERQYSTCTEVPENAVVAYRLM